VGETAWWLEDGTELGPTLQDGGEPLTDLRAMLGPSRYAVLVRRALFPNPR